MSMVHCCQCGELTDDDLDKDMSTIVCDRCDERTASCSRT